MAKSPAEKPVAGTRDADCSLSMTRRFAAPREAVFAAWTDPAAIARWIGPRSIKAEVKAMTAKPGGSYRIAMHGANGSIMNVSGTYREVVPPERLVFTWAWERFSPSGQKEEEQDETLVTVEFHERGTWTEVVLTHELFQTAEQRDRHSVGWNGCFDVLARALESTQEST